MSGRRPFLLAALIVAAVLMFGPGSSSTYAQQPVPDWPGLYDPFVMLDFNIEMTPANWDTVVNDTTLSIEVPSLFWAEGEAPILVSVRRKSAELLGVDKVSLKVDINEYTVDDANGDPICDPAFNSGFDNPTCVNAWHGVKKLSLENGDDINVITEGLAWYLNREAAATSLDFTPGKAAWVTVAVNGASKGVYVNVEQRDKQFLKNRGMWNADNTWLYKYGEIRAEIKEAPPGMDVSPAQAALCYLPFTIQNPCPEPADFKDQLNAWINMEGLLTFGAVSAFMGSPDDLYNKDGNYYIVDYSLADGRKREYVQWDLDSAFGWQGADDSIYDQGPGPKDRYEAALVESPDAPFRAEYEAIMCRLVQGPFQEGALHTAFDAIEAEIGAAVDADPANNIDDDAASIFNALRQKVTDRITSIEGQVTCTPLAIAAESAEAGADDALLKLITVSAIAILGLGTIMALRRRGSVKRAQ